MVLRIVGQAGVGVGGGFAHINLYSIADLFRGAAFFPHQQGAAEIRAVRSSLQREGDFRISRLCRYAGLGR